MSGLPDSRLFCHHRGVNPATPTPRAPGLAPVAGGAEQPPAPSARPCERPEDLVAVLYDTLRGLARRRLGQERRSPTFQPTELVHDAFLRLVEQPEFQWKSRRYVFGAAAEAMRRILVERARRRRRVRHGGHLERVSFRSDLLPAGRSDSDFLALNQAIERLEAQDARKATVVKLRYLIGLTIEQTAEALELSPATVKQDWCYSRAWLHREMYGSRLHRSRPRAPAGGGPRMDPERGKTRPE